MSAFTEQKFFPYALVTIRDIHKKKFKVYHISVGPSLPSLVWANALHSVTMTTKPIVGFPYVASVNSIHEGASALRFRKPVNQLASLRLFIIQTLTRNRSAWCNNMIILEYNIYLLSCFPKYLIKSFIEL